MKRLRTLSSCFLSLAFQVFAQDHAANGRRGPDADLTVILGRPEDASITLSILSARDIEGRVEYGTVPEAYTNRTDLRTFKAGAAAEVELTQLKQDTKYCYRLLARPAGAADFKPELAGMFQTQRTPGCAFAFAVQGDSHPEREGKMYDPDLYAQTMRNVMKDQPDFYMAMGDDFSIERLIERQMLSQAAVDEVYIRQRRFLGMVGQASAVFLVNGNHEQAALCNLDGKSDNCSVLAARARNRFFPLPAPDAFYGGDSEQVQHIGLLRDYYSWTWGDALFVVIDPYWHSPSPVDNVAGIEGRGRHENKGGRKRDLWSATLGEAQYWWLHKTLTESKARWKFVFCHHVLGTGRGGIEMASLCEWGGKDKRGVSAFAAKRPAWDLPVHELMARNGVTVFFQGHDHLYARQELDGVIYQSCPNPADPTYQAFNRDAYRSGDIMPNSGHLRVTVSPREVSVDYVRSWRPEDETPQHQNGELARRYTIPWKETPK